MGTRLLGWLMNDSDGRSLFRDLRSGRAGAIVRMGLSLAVAALCLAVSFFFVGLFEAGGGNVRDHHIGMMIGSAALLWGGVVILLWWSYPRFGRLIRLIVITIALWAVTVPVIVTIVELVPRGDFLVASVVGAAIAVTIATIAIGAYGSARGRDVLDRRGRVTVNCPTCRYSLVGLESTTCPECGARFTVDQIILAQGYHLDDTAVAVATRDESPPARLLDGADAAVEPAADPTHLVVPPDVPADDPPDVRVVPGVPRHS